MKEFWTPSSGSRPITEADLKAAFEKIRTAPYDSNRIEALKRASQFLENMPKHLRNHPLVCGVADLIRVQAVISPKMGERLKAALEKITTPTLE